VVLELTRRCGRDCEVCFHRDMRSSSVAQRDMEPELARRAIRLAAEAGARRVRLTGGEPMLHPWFERLLGETRNAGLEPWVNTAGWAAGPSPWRMLGRMASDVLLPLRGAEQRRRMCAAVGEIRAGGPARVRFGVVLTPERIAELAEIATLSRRLGCPLEAYRVMTVPGHVAGNTAGELAGALAALDRINRWFPPSERVRVANAVPFCVVPDRRLAARNCVGGRLDDGRSRLVVSPEGEVRPSYPMRMTIGNVARDDLAALWQHPAMIEMHAASSLPPTCQACDQLMVCCGGSRHEARLEVAGQGGMDPLAARA
jgi:radical SAM protein with 4Fe4S-binding SPASM domain